MVEEYKSIFRENPEKLQRDPREIPFLEKGTESETQLISSFIVMLEIIKESA